MQWFMIGAAILIIAILIKSSYETHHFKIKEYVIKTNKIKGDVKFGFITDLHNCRYGRNNETAIEAVLKQDFAFLILGGDLISGKRDIGKHKPEKYYANATEFLKGICKKVPLYYVYGNHETRIKNRRENNPLYNAYIESIENLGIEFINDKTAAITKDGNNIILEGIELKEQAYNSENGFKMQDNHVKADGYKVLTVHSPDYFDEYAKGNSDLILCGHNHGGTIRLPFVGGIVSRKYKLFPKYSYGEYEKNGKKMILTSGLGDHTIHFRLFNMPEIVVVKLVGGEKQVNVVSRVVPGQPDISKKVFEKEKKSDRI